MHSCAIFDSGKVKCWGSNGDGQLGIGRKDGVWKRPSELPFVILGETDRAIQLALGDHHSCALLDSGKVKCWGRNSFGQTGAEIRRTVGTDAEEMATLSPVPLPGDVRLTQIATSETVSCGVTDRQDVWCWGDVRNDGPTEYFERDALKGATQITLGSDFGCGRFGDGSVRCWGVNDEGQLGAGFASERFTRIVDNFKTVMSGSGMRASAVSAGMSHACARLNDGRVKCWGSNSSGQLGLGDRAVRGREPISNSEGLTAIDFGAGLLVDELYCGLGNHCCARVADAATIKCWGSNGNGQAGGNTPTNQVGDEPGEMSDELPYIDFGTFARVKKVAVGHSHSCGLTEQERVMCWGYDISPQTRAFSRVPIDILF